MQPVINKPAVNEDAEALNGRHQRWAADPYFKECNVIIGEIITR